MSYAFDKSEVASFKMKYAGDATTKTFKGVNATVQSADVICDGMASLLSCASLTGYYDGAIRVVNEDVYEE